MEWGYAVSGLLIGFLVGMTGVGGGSLMTPLLIFFYGIPPALAVGTDLLFASITKAGGTWVHHIRNTIQWRVVGLLALGSLPAAIMTLFYLKHYGAQGKDIKTLINTTLGIALMLTALVLFVRPRIQAFAQGFLDNAPPGLRQARPYITILMGLALGVLVTLSSVGAGALGAAMLTFLYPRMASIRIVGTDIVHAVPLTAVAGLGHFSMGSVDLHLLGNLLLGSLPGIYLGSHVGASIPEKIVRPILASMLVLIGVKFIMA